MSLLIRVAATLFAALFLTNAALAEGVSVRWYGQAAFKIV